MTKRYSHEDLRSWGASLDREQPQGLGETLLCYADDWRNEVERLRDANEQFAQRQEWWNERMFVLEEQLRAVVAAEREACAKVCESEGQRVDASWQSCADAIRARGK